MTKGKKTDPKREQTLASPPPPDRPDHARLPSASLEPPPHPEPSGHFQVLLQLICPECETPIFQPLLHQPAPPITTKPTLPLPCSIRCWCCHSILML